MLQAVGVVEERPGAPPTSVVILDGFLEDDVRSVLLTIILQLATV